MLCQVPHRLCSLSLGQGSCQGIPGETHSWEVIQFEGKRQQRKEERIVQPQRRMTAAGARKGMHRCSVKGVCYLFFFPKRDQAPLVFLMLFILSMYYREFMLINTRPASIFLLYAARAASGILKLRRLERTTTQLHHIIFRPRWQNALNVFAFEHFSLIFTAY